MTPGWQSPKLLLLVWFLLTVALTDPLPAFAWGDEGHKVIALIAEHYLDPAVRSKVATLLAADTDTLTAHDVASEATWADKYRDSDRNGTKIRYEATWRLALCGCRTGAAGSCRGLFRPSCALARDSGIERPAASLRG